MKLLNNFPEISIFFSKKSFDDEELKSFIDFIENKYSDKYLKKTAVSLIKLEVLKYELELEKNTNSKPLYLFDYETESIEVFSQKFQVSSNLIIEMLKQKGFVKNESDFLDLNQYLVLEDFFKSRKKAINRKVKQEQRLFKRKIKTVKKSIYKGIPVYQKISQNGGVGKLIYIKKNNICELCKKSAPFKDNYGNIILEIHHINFYQKMRTNTIDNVAEICPNCHGEIHNLNLK